MSSKLPTPNPTQQSRNDAVSLRKAVVVLFILTTLLFDFVSSVWSVKAMDRLKAQAAAISSSPVALDEEFEYKVAVFYGNRQQRLKNRKCEQLKCEFVLKGCVITKQDPSSSFTCHQIWSEMLLPGPGDCPYTPCEGYNQQSVCVSNDRSCLMQQGQLVHFGLCNDHKRCCLFPVIP